MHWSQRPNLKNAWGMPGVVITPRSRVEQDSPSRWLGVIHPGLKLCPGATAPVGFVGETEVDHVGPSLRDGGGKAVFRYTWHVDQVGPAAGGLVVVPGPAGHGVGVHIHRVHRVADRYPVFPCKQVHDVAAVALGPVGDEDLTGLDVPFPA